MRRRVATVLLVVAASSVADWYVSPTGVVGNTGAIGSPWDLASVATGHSGSIAAGGTVWLRGGTDGLTDAGLTFTKSGVIGSGVDAPDGKVHYRGYRSDVNDVSTLERAKIVITVTTTAASAGAITVNGVNSGGTVSLNKATNAQAVS